MKKVLFIVAMLLGASSMAQHGTCGTTEMIQDLRTSDPEAYEEYVRSQAALRQAVADFKANTDREERVGPYIVPVVFHVVYDDASSNIGDAQLYDALRVLNEDFQKTSGDTANIKAEFVSIAADLEFEFRLAKRKPNGECFSGITRTYSTTTNLNKDYEVSLVHQVSSEHGVFPGDQYLNIFIIKSISGTGGPGTTLGYANFPGMKGTSMRGGIYMTHWSTGTIGTAAGNNGRTLSHEAGHWLGLRHTFGDPQPIDGILTWEDIANISPGDSVYCYFDDDAADTPPTSGSFSTCNLNEDKCGNVLANVQNIMDYSACAVMFSEDQKTITHAAITGVESNRQNVISQENLEATGVLEGDILCAADFSVNYDVVCVGQSVSFTDQSYHAPTSWSWTFSGATPATSTAQNPTVVFNTPGSHDVTLTVTNANGSVSTTKSSVVITLGTAMPWDANQDFEDFAFYPEGWMEENGGRDDYKFTVYDGNGSGGSQKSLYLNNFSNETGLDEVLYSPVVDLSGISSAVIHFNYAYKSRTSSDLETVKIFMSQDCGRNWVQVGSQVLSPGASGIETQEYFPTSDADWTLKTVNIPASYLVSDARVAFVFESSGGNNFFIDNIMVGEPATLGLETSIINNYSLYPNPATSTATLDFNAIESGQATVEVVNLNGQTVSTPFMGEINAGNQNITINVNELPAGVYFVSLTLNGVISTQRLVVE